MSDTEEESSNSESWPVNEDWLLGVLKQHHRNNSSIKITVNIQPLVPPTPKST